MNFEIVFVFAVCLFVTAKLLVDLVARLGWLCLPKAKPSRPLTSTSFMTPVGYRTSIMIYGPKQYKFIDFVRVGTPLKIISWILATVLISVFWKF